VIFALSHVNLIINKDFFLVQNIQIFIYFNYSLDLCQELKTEGVLKYIHVENVLNYKFVCKKSF